MNKKQLMLGSCSVFLSSCLNAGTMGPVMNDGGSVYIRGDLGFNFFVDPDAQTASASNAPINAFDSSVRNKGSYGFGLGYRFLPSLRADLDYTYRPNARFQATDNIPETGAGYLRNYTVMLNGYVDLNINLPVTPYVMGGIGVSNNATTSIYWPVVQQYEYGRSTTNFAWQLGLGMAYALQPNFLVDLSYQYVDLGKFSNTGHYNTGGIFNNGLVGAPTSFSALYSNQVQIGLRYYIY